MLAMGLPKLPQLLLRKPGGPLRAPPPEEAATLADRSPSAASVPAESDGI